MNADHKFETVAAYFSAFPKGTVSLLEQIRKTIKKKAPGAEETISYNMPTFRLKGILVHYAAYKNHIGFYPGSEAIHTFSDALLPYKSAKGSVQFPLDKPLPIDLIAKITAFRVTENLEKASMKPSIKK